MTTKAEMRDQPKRHSAAPAALALSGAVNTGRSVTAWFRPRVEPSVSPAYLAHWALTPLQSTRRGRDPSAFLPTFAPQTLLRFIATMRTLTPAPLSPRRRSPCFTRTPSSPAFRPQPPRAPLPPLSHAPLARQVSGGGREDSRRHAARPSLHAGPGFAISQQARRPRQAESGSSSCGPPARRPLLPTPPRGDAVTAGFWSERQPGGEFHPSDSVRSQAHWERPPGLDDLQGLPAALWERPPGLDYHRGLLASTIFKATGRDYLQGLLAAIIFIGIEVGDLSHKTWVSAWPFSHRKGRG